MAGFDELLQFITSGDDVTAGNANRAPIANDQNVRYLRDIFAAAQLGQAIFFRGVTVDPATVVGSPVYWSPETQKFELGLAGTETDPSTGAILTTDASRIWGVISKKCLPGDKADICLFGVIPADISGVTDAGDNAAGLYYLSGVTPGMLVLQRPPVSVPVLHADGQGQVYVNPQLKDFLEDHVHNRFDLTALPAGSVIPPIPGERHVITAPDDTLPGWLPASESIFDSKAPVGAAFGYNLAAEPQLENAWPPLPINHSDLQWDRGKDEELGLISIPQGSDGLVILDKNGIWWMSDCYDDVPWPTNLDTTDSTSSDISASSDDAPECPRDLQMRLVLWFTRVLFATDQTVVTSLVAIDDRILVRCALDGLPGSTGDLTIDLDLGFQIQDLTTEGHVVFKELTGDNNDLFNLGPVVEGLFAGDNVALSSATTLDVGGLTLYQGRVTVAAATQTSLEVDIKAVRLDNATEEIYKDVTYIGLPSSKTAAYRAKLKIPDDLAVTTPTLKLRFRLLGRVAGTFPALTLTARIVPRPTNGLITPEALPLIDSAVTIATGAVVTANTYVEAESEEITVTAGDVVYFTFSRAGSDGYAGEIGVIDQVGAIA